MAWGLSLIRAFWAKLVAFFAVASLKRPPQNNECYILKDLPLEIILAITDDISTLDKTILAQTCSQFRHILHTPSNIYSSASALAPEEHSEYLFKVSRADPNLWLCEKCHTLHEFDLKDTNRNPYYIACPSRKQYANKYTFFFQFWPQHRHVQLALKFSRQEYLNSRQQQHYTNLTCRLHGIILMSVRRPSLRGVYEMYPEIVQGRFLLKTVRYFEDTQWNSPNLVLDELGLTNSLPVRMNICTTEIL